VPDPAGNIRVELFAVFEKSYPLVREGATK
jgi:hypothetical protein